MAISSPSLRMWGRFEHSLDDKGRVIVPLKFRDKLGEEFILTTGPDHHIRAYPMPVWETMEEQLTSTDVMDELNPDLTFLQRLFGNGETVNPDQQNRLTLPRQLRDWAQLREGDTAVIIGNGSRVEIWSRANWEQYSTTFTTERAAEAIANRKKETPARSEAITSENAGN